MPILIYLKEPPLTLIVNGEIKDGSADEWDKIFGSQVLMVKNESGRNVLVPLTRESNIAFMQEVTEEEVARHREEVQKRREGPAISKPHFVFPQGRRRKQ